MKQLPEVNQDIRSRLKDITCFALDMDGTVYLGTKWIEGAVDFLKAVEKAGKQYIFLTNNSSKGPENYVEKLAAMGLIVTKDRIVLSEEALSGKKGVPSWKRSSAKGISGGRDPSCRK